MPNERVSMSKLIGAPRLELGTPCTPMVVRINALSLCDTAAISWNACKVIKL